MTKPTSRENRQLEENERFLGRWSRMKQAAREQSAEDNKPPVPAETDPQLEVRQLTDADMPPLESLTEDSDYSCFLSPRVSEALRREALKKLFHSPGFNIRDGLDDYDEEFTSFAELGEIVTADMRHKMETDASRMRELLGVDSMGEDLDTSRQPDEVDGSGVQDSDTGQSGITGNDMEPGK